MKNIAYIIGIALVVALAAFFIGNTLGSSSPLGSTLNIQSAISYLKSQGYVAYADPSGTLHVYDVVPNANNAYDLGATLTRFRELYAVNVDVSGTLAATTGVFTTANVTTVNGTTLNGVTFSGTTGAFTTVTASQGSFTTANVTTLNAPTGRTATYIVASNASASWQAQADYSDLQTALNAASALGGHQSVRAVGTFNLTTSLVPYSNVDLNAQDAVINVTINGDGAGVDFHNITNAVWESVELHRKGNTGAFADSTPACVVENGTSDNTLIFRHCKFYCEVNSTGTGEGSAGIQVGQASPVFEDCLGVGSNVTSTYLNSGIALYNCQLGAPKMTRCTGIGGIGSNPGGGSPGIMVTETCAGELTDCDGYAQGVQGGIWLDITTANLRRCRGYAQDGTVGNGIWARGGTSYLQECEGVSGGHDGSHAWWLGDGFAGTLKDCYGHPPISQAQFYYMSADNGRFRPFAGKPYCLLSGMQLFDTVANPGITLDIGTTPGAHDVAQAIDLTVGGAAINFNYTRVKVAADGYLYATPSSAPAGKVALYYPVMYAYNDVASMLLCTNQSAKVIGGVFLGPLNGDSNDEALRILTGAENGTWSFENTRIETIGTVAMRSDVACSNAPFYNCRIVGTTPNINSFAYNKIPPETVVRTTDMYHWTWDTGSYSTIALTGNTLYAFPLYIARPETMDRIAIQIEVTSVANNARLGIYANGTNLYPGTLVADCGTVSVGTTGVKAITINLAFTQPGLYWAVLVANGEIHMYGAPILNSPVGLNAGNFPQKHAGWNVAYAYAALPSTFTGGGSFIDDNILDVIAYRLASLD